MIDHRCNGFWLWPVWWFLLWLELGTAVAAEVDAVRVTDYFISHTSNEPFYVERKLDPHVTLHVREVILAGGERTAANDGKILVLIHGATIPGYIAFDTNYEDCSLMRHFARAGWDTFALDLEGFGLSTRPILMDDPAAYPDNKAPMHVAVTVRDVERTVDFVNALRGSEKINLLGWSQGASLEAPLYTIQHPDKVAKLVLVGVAYDLGGNMDERRKTAADREAQKVRYTEPSLNGWAGLGTKAEFVIPGCFDAYRAAHLASDPKSGELAGKVRYPAGRSVDQGLAQPHFDAAKITVPTLVIRGDADIYATHDDNQRLVAGLRSTLKEFVEIPKAGHFFDFETTNKQFYQAVEKFLENNK